MNVDTMLGICGSKVSNVWGITDDEWSCEGKVEGLGDDDMGTVVRGGSDNDISFFLSFFLTFH